MKCSMCNQKMKIVSSSSISKSHIVYALYSCDCLINLTELVSYIEIFHDKNNDEIVSYFVPIIIENKTFYLFGCKKTNMTKLVDPQNYYNNPTEYLIEAPFYFEYKLGFTKEIKNIISRLFKLKYLW